MPEWHGAPVTKAHTDLGDLILVWDTGAARGVIRKKSADDLHATVSNQIVSLPHLNFGGTDGFVGGDFFASHVVCIDFPGSRLLVRH
jgi:hypothetical protein